MRGRRSILALVLSCAACAAPPDRPTGPVRAAEVTLYRDTVTAQMTDGSLCAGVRRARSGPWRTVLAGCPHPWPVAVLRPADRARVPLRPAASEPWVVLTSPAGSRGFAPRN